MYRESMDFSVNGSTFMGAILMSNRKTKLECLKRKLFGLPASQAGFMKKIKAGMLLFLFEYEERKLYGVFEATSDGAMNIIPNAYISSGKSFPAQILFKRIWMCKPLTEEEFHDAIKENYYQPSKFNFGLSYEQVYKLIYLFFPKRIGLKQYNSGIPNMVIQEFEKSENHSKYYKRNVGTLESFEVGLKQTIPDGTKPLTDLTCSTSQNGHSRKSRFYIGPSCDPHENTIVPGYAHELASISLVTDHTSLAQEPTACMRSLEDTLDLSLRSQLHPSQHNFSDLSSSNHSEGTLIKNTESSYRINSPKVELGMHSFTSELKEENEHEDQRLNHVADDGEDYQITANSKLRSDIDQSRTSVFSRLSGTVKSHEKYDEVQESYQKISLHQLLQTLSEKREQWNMGTTILSQKRDQWNTGIKLEYNQSVVQVDDEEREVAGMKQDTPAFLSDSELSSEPITIQGGELPFYNFKRRNGVRKTEYETYSNDHLECSQGNECMKHKRRRLVRPSFSEEAYGSSQEIGQVEALIKNGEHKSAEYVTSSVKSDIESELTDTEASIHDNNESAISCRSAVSSGNARWLLLKSIFDKAKSSNGDPTEEDGNANNESHAVSSSELSFLPAHNRRDLEIGGIDGLEKDIETEDFLPLE